MTVVRPARAGRRGTPGSRGAPDVADVEVVPLGPLEQRGDVEDGVYDWNLLNGKAHGPVSRTCPRTERPDRVQVDGAGKRRWSV